MLTRTCCSSRFFAFAQHVSLSCFRLSLQFDDDDVGCRGMTDHSATASRGIHLTAMNKKRCS